MPRSRRRNLPNPTRTPVPPPLTFPVLGFLSATPNVHDLSYKDSGTPTSKAKPPGTRSMQLWLAIGVAPAVDPSVCALYGQFSKCPLVVNFTSGNTGKIATYFARWQTISGPGGITRSDPGAHRCRTRSSNQRPDPAAKNPQLAGQSPGPKQRLPALGSVDAARARVGAPWS